MRVKCYNRKGAKFPTSKENACNWGFVTVETVELLQRKSIWERKLTMAEGMEESKKYYQQKLDVCIGRLAVIKSQGFNVPKEVPSWI